MEMSSIILRNILQAEMTGAQKIQVSLGSDVVALNQCKITQDSSQPLLVQQNLKDKRNHIMVDYELDR